MTDERLGQLLFAADAAAAAGHEDVGAARDLPERVRARLRRRRARRRAIAVAGTALLVIAAVIVPRFRAARLPDANVAVVTPRMETRPGEVARLRDEIAALQARAEAGKVVVALMLRAEERARRQARTAVASDPVERIRDQQELAALALVRRGDRLYRELDRKASAANAYESVVVLFPRTPAAATARQRLVEIKG
jgi:hypothetical protein